MKSTKRVVGNPLSRRRKRRGGSLSKTGMIVVATLLGIFALAALYVFVLPALLLSNSPARPSSSSSSSSVMNAMQSNNAAAALRRRDDKIKADNNNNNNNAAMIPLHEGGGGGGPDWMEQQAELQVEEIVMDNSHADTTVALANNNQNNNNPQKEEFLLLKLYQPKKQTTIQENLEQQEESSQSSFLGTLRIRLRPDLSPESVAYIRSMVVQPDDNVVDGASPTTFCERCQFYRAEKPGILQGIMKKASLSSTNAGPSVVEKRGDCPPGFADVVNDCPDWDRQCACHGPIMTRGMVAWAGGGTGPDFFIDNYREPAKFWGTQHTVFGEILSQEESSFSLLDQIWEFPTHVRNGMTFLENPISFQMVLLEGTGVVSTTE